MRGAVIYGPKDVRLQQRPDPTIQQPTDAIVRTDAACVCGSDLWRYRGVQQVPKPTPIGRRRLPQRRGTRPTVPATIWCRACSPCRM